MTRIHVLVEGPTEESFVKRVLGPHLGTRGTWINPVLVTTKRVKCGPNFTGGVTSYHRVREDIRRLLGDTSAALVTTLIDYFGLPDEFPGKVGAGGTPQQKVACVEGAFKDDIGHARFRPYLSLHEFEALLFSSPPAIARALNGATQEPALADIRRRFPTPEDINDDPATVPSRRILDQFPRYNKVFYGSLIAQRIGLRTIREECLHFGEWLTALEAL